MLECSGIYNTNNIIFLTEGAHCKLKPATYLAILYADRGEFDLSENRLRFSPPIDADTPGDFFADRGDVAVLKTHVIKSPNLMGWLSCRFAAINVENRGNGRTWRMLANLIADI